MQSVPDDFWRWISKFNGEDIAGLVAIVSVFSVAAVGMICFTVFKVHKNRAEDALKRELLDRGLTADEIATIIRAKADKGIGRRSLPPVN